MEESRNILSQLINAYRGLPSDRKLILAVCLIIFIGALWFWASTTGQPEYGLLYGDLNLKDSGTIVSELQSKNIPYKLTNGGKDILVPAEQLHQIRIDLARDDVLPTSTTGFELFDKSNLGITEFAQQINRQRAIQGELERTLRAMDGVEFARVHLHLPEESPFMEDVQEAKASVMVKLAARYRALEPDKVAAIQNLVATADGRLDPETISVVDSKLNLLSKAPGVDELADVPDRLALKTKYETQQTEKIKGFLEKQFGVGNVAVGVTAELNFDRIEKEQKTYVPLEGTNKGVLSKEELEEEEETKGAGGQSAQGVPGTASNVPGYPATETGTYESESAREVKEYNVSETWEHTVLASGDVKKMSVSVLINAEEEDPQLVKDVEDLVLAAANLDTTRGDKIQVTMAPFDTTYLEELQAAMEEVPGFDWTALMKWIPSAVVLLIAVIIFFQLMKPIKEAYKLPRLEEIVEEEEIEMPPTDPDTVRKLKMREEITRMAKEDPESAARIIKTWLHQ
jgi:flagellar M-ring protein FliF